MKIYTRTGDQGLTGIFGGDRIPKNHLRIDAYGTVDETNSHLGLARAYAHDHTERSFLDQVLHGLQSELFILGADLATPIDSKISVPRIDEVQIKQLETRIDELQSELPTLKHFILPGGTRTASTIHIARTVCRRAERLTVALHHVEAINTQCIIYLNRLSDLLFVFARWVNIKAGLSEEAWKPA